MKQLNNFILEKLKISSKSKVIDFKYFPENYDELRNLLTTLIEQRGPNADLNDIDTSKITNMQFLFNKLNVENIQVDCWDVSNVVNMKGLFQGHKKFNCNLNKWDVSNVENMANMFEDCESFNSDLSNWNVSKVKTLSWTFGNCKSFEGKGLEKWNVSNVESLYRTFSGCTIFNGDLSSWKVTKVKYFNGLFDHCENYDGNGIDKWDVTTTTISFFSQIFNGAKLIIKNRKIPAWYKGYKYY